MPNGKIEREEENMIKDIYEMEDIFLKNPTKERARDLINKWEELKLFRKYNNITEERADRIAPLEEFLNATMFHMKTESSLEFLRRIRHDD